GSGTVTFTFAATSNRNSAAVVEVASGFDATNPVAQVGKNGGDNISSLTVTLPGTPAASSLIITGLAGRNGGSATPPDGYVNLGANTGGTSVRRIDYGPGSAGGTIQFTDIDAVTDRPVAAAAIEIVEPSSGAQTIEPSAIAGGATVYQPSILPGAVSISPNFVDEGSQVYAPSLGVTIEPSAITSDA